MKTTRFEVLSQAEVERIHAASMEILAEVGIKVDYKKARDIFREAGAEVDEETLAVKFPEKLVRWAVDQAPKQFSLYRDRCGVPAGHRAGSDDTHLRRAGDAHPHHRPGRSATSAPSTKQDMIDHIILINACRQHPQLANGRLARRHPDDHHPREAIWAWAHNSRKPFGMGCYGYLPTWDMMRMMAIAVGGKEELQKRPRFFAICSVVSPLQMDQAQAEGLLICAEYGQPVTLRPRSHRRDNGSGHPGGAARPGERRHSGAHHPGADLPPRHAGAVRHSLHHRQYALWHDRAWCPETGLITAASAQMARYYGLPIRSVGGATESKREDLQAGFERMGTLLPAVLAGVNLITCARHARQHHAGKPRPADAGRRDSAARPCGWRAASRSTTRRLALDLIKKSGLFRQLHGRKSDNTSSSARNSSSPTCSRVNPTKPGKNEGEKLAIDHARERALEDPGKAPALRNRPAIEKELAEFKADGRHAGPARLLPATRPKKTRTSHEPYERNIQHQTPVAHQTALQHRRPEHQHPAGDPDVLPALLPDRRGRAASRLRRLGRRRQPPVGRRQRPALRPALRPHPHPLGTPPRAAALRRGSAGRLLYADVDRPRAGSSSGWPSTTP